MKKQQAQTLVVAGPVEDGNGHASPFEQFPWRIERTRNCLETVLYLHQALPRVVVCERDLPGGSWKHVLEIAAGMPIPPPVIVTSRLADDYLWAEVLNLGGYDVLPTPFDAGEVLRVAFLAWQFWKRDVGPRYSAVSGGKTARAGLRPA